MLFITMTWTTNLRHVVTRFNSISFGVYPTELSFVVAKNICSGKLRLHEKKISNCMAAKDSLLTNEYMQHMFCSSQTEDC